MYGFQTKSSVVVKTSTHYLAITIGPSSDSFWRAPVVELCDYENGAGEER